MKTKPLALLALTAALFTTQCSELFDPSTWFVSVIGADKPTYDGQNGDEIIWTAVIERAKFQSPEETGVVLELPAGFDEEADRWTVTGGALTLHAYSHALTARYIDSRKARFTFAPGDYTVTYDGNKPASARGSVAGSTAPSKHTCNIPRNLTPNGYSLAGWNFRGWNTEADGKGKNYTDEETVVNLTTVDGVTVTLFALWGQYSVTYHNMDGAANAEGNPAFYATADSPVTLGAPMKRGWTFGGWFTNSDLTTPAGTPAIPTGSAGNREFWAKWTANTYTLTYHANGADGGTAPASQKKTYETNLTLRTNSGSLTRTGYFFTGWNTRADGTGAHYAEGAVLTADLTDTDGASVMLYAQWTAKQYSIAYDGNGAAVGAPANQTKTYGTNLTLWTNSGGFGKPDCAFTRWNTRADGTGTDYAGGGILTGDLSSTQGDIITLYAQWQTGALNLSCSPASALTGALWDYSDSVYTIHNSADVRVFGTTTTDRIAVEDGANAAITLDNASITGVTNPFSLGSGANVTLRLAGTSTLTGNSSPGVEVGAGALTIVSATSGSEGVLNARGGSNWGSAGAGIHTTNGVLYILGGTVNARGELVTALPVSSAGIGGGPYEGGGEVHINHPTGGTSHGSANGGDKFPYFTGPAMGPGTSGTGGSFNGVEGGWPAGSSYSW